MGLDGFHPRELIELLGELTKPLSVIYLHFWLTRKISGDWRWENVNGKVQEWPEGGCRELQACQPDLGAGEGNEADCLESHQMAHVGDQSWIDFI